MATVIVTDGGRGMSRSALAATRALGSAGHTVITTESGRGELAALSAHSDRTVTVPRATDRRAFAAAIGELASAAAAVEVFATSDDAVLALRPDLARLLDKSRLAAELARLGIAAPRSYLLDAEAEPEEITFPAVVKPVTGSVPARRVDSFDELTRLAEAGPHVVQPFVDGPMAAVAGVIWEGLLVACVHQDYVRTWPVSCGTASLAHTVAPDLGRERDLVALLGDHCGIFQAQYVDGGLIDLNPRPYGSMPAAVAAGANLPDLVVRLRTGWRPDSTLRGREAVSFRWVEGDLRHLIDQTRRGRMTRRRALRELTPRRRTVHSVISLRDPRPALARARHMWSVARSRSPS